MKIYIIFALLCSVAISHGQLSVEENPKPIDYIKLKSKFNKPESQAEYQKLFQRYLKGDSTFTIQEKRLVYYGSVFQDFFNPYSNNTESQQMLEQLNEEQVSEESFDEINKVALLELTEDPFNLSSLWVLSYQYLLLENKQLSEKYLNRIKIVFDAIFSTGTGFNKDSALFVTEVNHEYQVLQFLGLSPKESVTLEDSFHYITLENNEELEGMYFEITPVFLFLTEE